MKQNTRKAAPQLTVEDQDFARASIEIFESTVADLALEEGEVAALSRRILRMRRDKTPGLDEVMKPLFMSILSSAMSGRGRTEIPGTNMLSIPIKHNRALKAQLQELRQSA